MFTRNTILSIFDFDKDKCRAYWVCKLVSINENSYLSFVYFSIWCLQGQRNKTIKCLNIINTKKCMGQNSLHTQ